MVTIRLPTSATRTRTPSTAVAGQPASESQLRPPRCGVRHAVGAPV